MRCPKCDSKRLDIRQPTGFERILIALTNRRKFHCRACQRHFRAPDLAQRETRQQASS